MTGDTILAERLGKVVWGSGVLSRMAADTGEGGISIHPVLMTLPALSLAVLAYKGKPCLAVIEFNRVP
jgi:hypothetical protein